MEQSNCGDTETDAEDAFENPWDQAFVGLIKNVTDKASIDLGLLYEQAQRQHTTEGKE